MCMYASANKDGVLGDKRFHHYTARAAGGVGAIVVESTAVMPNAGISVYDLGLYNDEQQAELKKLVDAVHPYGTKIGIQISHAGRKATGLDTIWSSSVGRFSDAPEYIEAKELSVEQIQEIVKAFGQAAKRAADAGFDFVEIHGAHGYLVSQFTSKLVNKRTDQYGGSLENRYRFVKEIIAEIRKHTNIDLHYRISLNEVEEGGNSIQENIQILKWAQADGVVFFDISSGGITAAPPTVFPGYQALLSREVMAAGLPCGAVGVINEPSLAEYLVRAGDCEVVYLARVLLKDPYWPLHAARDLHTEPDLPISVYVRGGF